MNGARVKVLTAVAVISLCGTGVADAETIRDTLDQFGFFGSWALHCDEPASPTNVVRKAFVSRTDDPTFSETLGMDSEPNIYVVLRAKRLDPATITVRTKLNGEIEQDLTIRREQDRVRTVDNREVVSGQYVVKNGVVASNNSETPWLTRCADKP